MKNRLENIRKQCETAPVIFSFILGQENPADVVTRPISHEQLLKTNFHSGPAFLNNTPNSMVEDGLTFQVPNPLSLSPAETSVLPAALRAVQTGSFLAIFGTHESGV